MVASMPDPSSTSHRKLKEPWQTTSRGCTSDSPWIALDSPWPGTESVQIPWRLARSVPQDPVDITPQVLSFLPANASCGSADSLYPIWQEPFIYSPQSQASISTS
ncbi:hypothetical protein M8818_004399 [Zalaria obscura]|uniref:Uncharacterized protein n=1 Tax=Zalaria obscura TaxID=2024903 RepID=A0ACC3SBU8_9PEZI